jgi:hypothetical protein
MDWMYSRFMMPVLPGDGTSKMKLEKEIWSVCMVCNI